MFAGDLGTYRGPRSGAILRWVGPTGSGAPATANDLRSGTLLGDGDTYELLDGIPRFCPRENYAASFGFQWNRYDRFQLDSTGVWGGLSERRLFEETEWPRDMRGERILEAGCGMGRFTQHLVATGADVWSIDYSTAVEANARNNGHRPNLHLAQADILHPPFAPESFDRVLCIGVIQHTPDPATLRQLAELDTVDVLAPAHDHPRTLRQVRRWFDRSGMIETRVRAGNGIEGIARKPF